MRVIQDFTQAVSGIVRSDYRTADVFKKHGINYCCSGQVTLHEACSARNLDYNLVLGDLTEATRDIQLSNSLKFSEWKLSFLIDFIVNVHHAYLKDNLSTFLTTLHVFIEGHKKKYAELQEVLEIFQELALLLDIHDRHEEEIIFPYIKQIESTHARKEVYGNLFVRTLRKPLSNIEREHRVIGELLTEIERVTNHYTFPPSACTNHQVIYHKLREFHDDLTQHKHLENKILFPRAIAMENELLLL
jgi:regulator of cell morphogenesis and NO signaling